MSTTMFVVLISLFIIYTTGWSGIQIRDRKAERQRIQAQYRLDLEKLDRKHKEKMAIIDAMKRDDLEKELSRVEMQIADLQHKTIENPPKEVTDESGRTQDR